MRILMTMFGWQETGGGTILPRQIALDLQQRGHQVMVLYASTQYLEGALPYAVSERCDEGVSLVGIHNWGAIKNVGKTVYIKGNHPEYEVEDPAVWDIFRHYFQSFQPDIVHYHNFYALSMGFTDLPTARGVPSFFTLHNFWLLCPTLYLYYENREICAGINSDGSNCARCTQSDFSGALFLERHRLLRQKCHQDLTRLWVSAPQIQAILEQQGYLPDKIEVIKLGNLRAVALWQDLGQQRSPFRRQVIRFGFMGTLLPVKGIHILVQAVQVLQGDFEVSVYGSCFPQQLEYLREMDYRQRISFEGVFQASDQIAVLSRIDVGIVPSSCYEQAGMAVEEFLAAGIPVIATDRGGLPFYLQPGTGQLVPGDDPMALAAAMQALIDDPDQIRCWQAQIQPPVSFGEYVSAMELRYQEACAHRVPVASAHPERAGTSALKIVLPLGVNTAWQNIFSHFLQTFSSDAPLELVLLPRGMESEAVQVLLVDLMTQAGLDPDAGPELLLLEPIGDPRDLQALFYDVDLLLVSDADSDLLSEAAAAGLCVAAAELPPGWAPVAAPALLADAFITLGLTCFLAV